MGRHNLLWQSGGSALYVQYTHWHTHFCAMHAGSAACPLLLLHTPGHHPLDGIVQFATLSGELVLRRRSGWHGCHPPGMLRHRPTCGHPGSCSEGPGRVQVVCDGVITWNSISTSAVSAGLSLSAMVWVGLDHQYNLFRGLPAAVGESFLVSVRLYLMDFSFPECSAAAPRNLLRSLLLRSQKRARASDQLSDQTLCCL